jgi:hypothetical protein
MAPIRRPDYGVATTGLVLREKTSPERVANNQGGALRTANEEKTKWPTKTTKTVSRRVTIA